MIEEQKHSATVISSDYDNPQFSLESESETADYTNKEDCVTVTTTDNNSMEFKAHYGPQFFATLAACFGSMCLGTVLSWTSPALPSMRENKEIFGNISDFDETWISSISLLGAAFSCLVVGSMMERWGRKFCMLILCCPFIIGWVFIILAQNIEMIYAGRFITGFCGGGLSLVVPVYITEIASINIRGMLTSAFDMMITVGILYIFLVGTYLDWQYQAVACAIIPVLFAILMVISPESPQYLTEQGKIEQATTALCWLRGTKSRKDVENEMKELLKSVEESKSTSASWKDIFQDKTVLRPTVIAVGLMVFQQLTVIDAVMFYTVDIFKAAGTNINENLSANIVGGAQVVATVSASIMVDYSGRRFLFLISEAGCCIALGGMGLFFYMKEHNNQVPPNIVWLPLASLILLCVAFSVGLGPLPWLLMGELLPPNVKGLASGIITITRWILGFTVTILFKQMMIILGVSGCYWLFSACSLLGLFFIYFCVPETKGQSLDEIRRLYRPSSEKNIHSSYSSPVRSQA